MTITCPNHELNQQQCPCPKTDCENHGICCLCVARHLADGSLTACMRGVSRPESTRSLPVGLHPDCSRRVVNTERCACSETSCARHGLCCDCIRFHWGNRTWPSPACQA